MNKSETCSDRLIYVIAPVDIQGLSQSFQTLCIFRDLFPDLLAGDFQHLSFSGLPTSVVILRCELQERAGSQDCAKRHPCNR